MIRELTDDTFEAQVLQSQIPSIILFTAGYCTYCDDMVPQLESLEEKYEGLCNFFIANSDQQRKLRIKFVVAAVPYVVMVNDGIITPLFDMIVPKEQLDERINYAINGGSCPVNRPLRW